MKSGSMHVSSVKTSPRLKKLLAFLFDKQPHSTREIGEALGLEAVGSSISELRRNGYWIDCEYKGRTLDGSKIYTYQLQELEAL